MFSNVMMERILRLKGDCILLEWALSAIISVPVGGRQGKIWDRQRRKSADTCKRRLCDDGAEIGIM